MASNPRPFDLSQLRTRWRAYAQQILMVTGLALLVAGFVFFFAYNWRELHRLLKLGVVEIGFVLCLLLAHVRWRHGYIADGLRVCAGALVGVLLAVFGQQYQTGADAYELFLSWAVLILPLVLLARVAALWVLWLAVVHAAAIFWWDQVAGPEGLLGYESLCLILAGLDILALAVREVLLRRGTAWLAGCWLRWLLIAAVLATLLGPASETVMMQRYGRPGFLIALLCSLGAIGAGYFVYLRLLPDLAALALSVLASTYVLLLFYWQLVFEALDLDSEAGVLLMGVGSLGIFAGAAFVLHGLHRRVRPESKERAQAASPDEAPEERVATRGGRDAAPWYVQALLGVGGWLSAVFFVIFLAMSHVFEEAGMSAVLGAMFFGLSAFFVRTARGSFAQQALVALALVGNAGLLIGLVGLVEGGRELPVLFWGQLLFCAAGYSLLRNDTFRFVTLLLVPVFGGIWLWEIGSRSGLQALLAGELLVAASLWVPPRIPASLRALRLASLTVLPVSVVLFDLGPVGPGGVSLTPTWPILALICAILLALYRQIAGASWLRDRGVQVAVVATFALTSVSAQGLMVGLLLFVLAFARQHGYALVLALLFLPCFFVGYYYSLQVDLRYKSWLVAGTGLVLLAVRPFLAEPEERVA